MFRPGNRDIPVYVSVPKKDPAAKVLKLPRKNEKNPAVAVDDELGLMAVLDGRAEVTRFVEHQTKAAVSSGVLMKLEDISDTLSGDGYAAKSVGSSSETPMLKFFARLGDARVEFIIHTNQSYLDYHHRRGVSHEEYEFRRIFDSGVAEFLFPGDIYQLDMVDLRDDLLQRFDGAATRASRDRYARWQTQHLITVLARKAVPQLRTANYIGFVRSVTTVALLALGLLGCWVAQRIRRHDNPTGPTTTHTAVATQWPSTRVVDSVPVAAGLAKCVCGDWMTARHWAAGERVTAINSACSSSTANDC